MRELIAEARYVAETDSKILITGESGVGKELLARLVHESSPRSGKPMATFNCAGVPETLIESELFGHTRGAFTDAHADRRGLFEVAHGGTILLDEVGEMSVRMQALLLRVLENGEIQRVGSDRFGTRVDTRIIAATNRDLLQQTEDKQFRLDLYYRLNVVSLYIPPLRERPCDIGLLFHHFLETTSQRFRLPICTVEPEALEYLEGYHWPGNVRELRNVAERVSLRFAGRSLTGAAAPSLVASRAKPAPAPVPGGAAESVAAACFQRMVSGMETFWTVVHEPFMQRDLTRDVVRSIVRQGLQQTKGSYRLMAPLFNLPQTDYKRFLTFLEKYDCHLPFQPFRAIGNDRAAADQGNREATRRSG